MPRKKKVKLSESYISLILGFLVVLVVSAALILFAKGKTYDRINTAISIFQEPANFQTVEKEPPKTYEIKPGDNLWSIAEEVYGSGYNWVDLAKANNLSNPNLVLSGNKLIIPVVQKITVATVEPTQNNSPSISGSNYKIVKGDSLWNVAIRKYGDGYKWPEIARVNEIQNPDLIYANSILKLP